MSKIPRMGVGDLSSAIEMVAGSDQELEDLGQETASTVELDWSTASPAAAAASGPDLIASIARTLPAAPGVYRMIAGNSDVLYVGKAKNLKNRVTSYARPIGQNNRIARMIAETTAMEFVRTRSEAEALLLEANLIKRLRPRFNVLLRDDKSFPYILIRGDHPAPALVKHRGAKTRKGDYFGPFASAGAVNRTMTALQKAFLLRTCSDSVYHSRTRPCLLYQIKRCSAPCTGEISLEDYDGLVGKARSFLSGRSAHVQRDLAALMERASEALDFESAAIYRDRLSALSLVQTRQDATTTAIEEADVFALAEQAGQVCVQVFFYRMGQNWGNRAYYPRIDKSMERPEILASFLTQFYDDKPLPTQILLNIDPTEHDLLEEAFSQKSGRNVRLRVPQRGAKRDLVEHAAVNAREALARKLAETASQARLLAGVAEVFELDEPPTRIEVYDNSHIMGSNAVGAMVVAGPEGFQKSHYRKFNIKSEDITPGDDFGMMREVMRRRFARLQRESGSTMDDRRDDTGSTWPDLVLIDGGKGHLAAAAEVLDELGIVNLPLVAVAKGRDRDAGRETFLMRGRRPLTLPHRDPVLYFIQRLRDEAHRFAIGSHRARRKKSMTRSPLDEIAGIGPARKRALLRHFGSAKGVSRAGIEDLTNVDGISDQMARNIYGYFHDTAT